MSATTTRPAWKRPGATTRPDLAPVEGDGERGGDRRSGDLTGGGVDAGRHVDGDHRGPAGVHPLDQRCRLGPGRTLETRPEQRVDDDVVAFGLVGLDCLATRLPHHTRRDPPVASVGAAAAHHGEAAGTRVRPHRLPGHRGACAVHQLGRGVRVPRIPLLRGTHLRGGVEGLQHVQRAPRRRRTVDVGHAHRAGHRARVRQRDVDLAQPDPLGEGSVFPLRVTPGFWRPTISISFQVNRTPQPSAFPTASLPQNRAA